MELTEHDSPLLHALKVLTDREGVAFCCTLKDLHLMLCNELHAGAQISFSDFQHLYQEGMRGEDHQSQATKVYQLIANARLEQKLKLYKGFVENTDWRKYQWLLETKFADFDSKTRSDFQEKQPMPDLVYTSRLIDADEEEED